MLGLFNLCFQCWQWTLVESFKISAAANTSTTLWHAGYLCNCYIESSLIGYNYVHFKWCGVMIGLNDRNEQNLVQDCAASECKFVIAFLCFMFYLMLSLSQQGTQRWDVAPSGLKEVFYLFVIWQLGRMIGKFSSYKNPWPLKTNIHGSTTSPQGGSEHAALTTQ